MFNLYQNINKKEEEKEPQVIGHERFYQERTSRSSSRRKKRVPHRSHSASEFSPGVLNAANKRAAFHNRCQSSENRSDDGKVTPQRTESFARVFFSRRSSGAPKHEYSALKTEGGNEKFRAEQQIRNGVFMACKHYLSNNDRYELKTQLGEIGSRTDKHWFTVQDTTLGAERLLTLVPMPSMCPLNPTTTTRDTLLELFRGLQHPYIHPVLDIDFWDAGAALISPLNPSGSLKDLIYGSPWHEDYDKKYNSKGEGLPLRTVQCLGRQILEGLLFLRNRYFPPFYHLHSGNVIIQNGVARIAGLENALLGLLPRAPSAPETLAFGYILFEMTAGYELPKPPSPAHLQLELERAPKVAEALELIFQISRPPALEELVCCELFRGVELRELRGASIIQVRSSPEVLELLEVVRNPVPPSPLRRLPLIKARKKFFRRSKIQVKHFNSVKHGRKTFVKLLIRQSHR
ncbi:slowpoke-binding protein isoform X2 [Tribolium madens]|uniref:slowpoke-binding protein isoform X2 n=1 Tax=Tribolium madens TaxID=41895 RepID=UPI001CF763F1|nr:slowpoke-binding protein isoform X2 [Tribolium madens]